MLSENALSVAYTIRRHVGPDAGCGGPTISELRERLGDMSPADLRRALDELAGLGFIRLDTGIPMGNANDVPAAIRNVVGLSVREPLQVYFDDLGL